MNLIGKRFLKHFNEESCIKSQTKTICNGKQHQKNFDQNEKPFYVRKAVHSKKYYHLIVEISCIDEL